LLLITRPGGIYCYLSLDREGLIVSYQYKGRDLLLLINRKGGIIRFLSLDREGFIVTYQ